MKKYRHFIIMIMMVLVLTGCGGKDENDNVNGHATETVREDIMPSGPGIDLNGTYDKNDLLIKSVKTKIGEVVAEVPQIDGLKDIEIQNKINKEMYEKIIEETAEIETLDYVNYTEMANFANVISIAIYWTSEETYGQIYFNYNLLNGEKLDFEELFYGETDLIELVRKAFFESLVLNQETENVDENEFYRYVKSFMDSKDKKFAFTPRYVYIYQNDYTASIAMEEIPDKIAIYSRYLTEDQLYDGEYNGRKDVFNCVDIYEDAYNLLDYGLLHENCWYDLTILKEYIADSFPKDDLAQYNKFKKERQDYYMGQIKYYGERAIENPDKFYIILSKPDFYLESDSIYDEENLEWIEIYKDKVSITENFTIIEMPIEMYEEVYKEKILEAYRYPYLAISGGIHLNVTENNVLLDDYYGEKRYNYMTGEELD